MKRSILMVTAAVAMLLLPLTQTAFAWSFDIVETTDNVYDLVLSTEEEIEFNGGSFAFLYDNDDTLTWSYAIDLPGWQNWFDTGDTAEASDSDIVLTLMPEDFFSYLTVADAAVLATFTFEGEGDADLCFNLDDANMIVEIDGGMYDIQGNPVPVPAAVWLLGSGLIGLIGIRRRQA
jgi:hypothetical protein